MARFLRRSNSYTKWVGPNDCPHCKTSGSLGERRIEDYVEVRKCNSCGFKVTVQENKIDRFNSK